MKLVRKFAAKLLHNLFTKEQHRLDLRAKLLKKLQACKLFTKKNSIKIDKKATKKR